MGVFLMLIAHDVKHVLRGPFTAQGPAALVKDVCGVNNDLTRINKILANIDRYEVTLGG